MRPHPLCVVYALDMRSRPYVSGEWVIQGGGSATPINSGIYAGTFENGTAERTRIRESIVCPSVPANVRISGAAWKP
jgi:hypothetical protein